MRTLAPVLILVLPLLAACGPDLESVPPGSSEHQVVGVLKSVDHHPEGSSVTITLVTERRLETVRLPDRAPGQPPSDGYVALLQKTNRIERGKPVLVKGTRDERGVLVVETIEVLK